MSDEKEPTQRTPAGEDIPVPKRSDFLKNLLKTAKKPPRSTPDRPEE